MIGGLTDAPLVAHLALERVGVDALRHVARTAGAIAVDAERAGSGNRRAVGAMEVVGSVAAGYLLLPHSRAQWVAF